MRLLCNLSYIPVDLGRVSTCAREVETLDESIRMKMADILLAASDALQRAYGAAVASATGGGIMGASNAQAMLSPMSAQSEHIRRLSDRIAALAAFAGQSKFSNLARGSSAF